MKSNALSGVVICVNFLLGHGLDLINSSEAEANNFSRRILNGSPANVENFPFLVVLAKDRNKYCGGTIVANQWVMTGAHCIKSPCNSMRIYPAILMFADNFTPIGCYTHPQFISDDTIHTYDIGMLKIAEDFLQDSRVKALPLPQPGTSFPVGSLAKIVGWGKTENAVYPKELLWAEVRVQDWNVCNQKYQQSICQGNPNCQPPNIPIRTLCTQGNPPRPGGTCFVDSGGPVVIDGLAAGIIAFGIKVPEALRCEVGSPSMHVNVADYLPWIYSFISPNVDSSKIVVKPEN